MWEININGIITIIAIVVYVIIFFIQKAQLNSQKGIISSMKTFIEIFDVDQVRKFAKMKEETTLDKAKRIIIKKPEIQEITKALFEMTKMPVKEYYEKHLTDSNNELINVCFMNVMNQKKELRESFINKFLPMNKIVINRMIEDTENNKP
jgi:hypothetical protein